MIWVEVLSRHHEVVVRHRCAGDDIRIGRGYDNDVVLDDPYVAPRHLRVFREEGGGLVAEDTGSKNGLYTDRGTARHERIALDGNRIIRIGRTHLRVRETHHAVAPERIARPPTRNWPRALALAAAVLAIEAVSAWLGETGDPKVSRYALPILSLVALALAWTTGWAILSRIFTGRARFGRHLAIAFSGLLGISLYTELSQYGAFALSWRAIAAYEYVGIWLAVAGLSFFHLRAIRPARLRLMGGIVAAVAALAIAMQTLVQSEARPGYDGQNYVRRLEPPVLRLAPLRDENAFFADAARMKGRLDRARTEEPPEGGYSGYGDD